MPQRFQVYQNRAKQWRWRLRGKNGEILASGESYIRRIDCMKAIELVRRVAADTPVDPV